MCIGIGSYLVFNSYFLKSSVQETKYIPKLIVTDYYKSKEINYPNGVVIIDGLALIPSYLGDSIILINATDPYNLTEFSHVTNRTYLDGAHDVDITMDKNYTYVISYSGKTKYLTMWNITNKTYPIRVNTTSLGSEIGMYLDLDDDDNFLYATTQKYIYIFNVTNKATYQMTQVAKFDTGRDTKFWHPIVYENTLYISQWDNTLTPYGVNVYNITNKSNPRYVNTLFSNRSIVDQVVYKWNDFVYLIADGGKKIVHPNKNYCLGYLACMNISANNATHPEWMFEINHFDYSTGNGTQAFGIDALGGYIFVQNNNVNNSAYNTGIMTFNWTDTTKEPIYLSKIYGKGAPNYLDDNHIIHADKNQSSLIVYTATCDDDTLTVLSFDSSFSYNPWEEFET